MLNRIVRANENINKRENDINKEIILIHDIEKNQKPVEKDKSWEKDLLEN